MFARRRLLIIPLVAALAFLLGPVPDGHALQQQEACTPRFTSNYCTSVVLVGDPDYPCVERDGHAYCPVVSYYRPTIIIVT